MSIIDIQRLVLVDQASPSSLSSQAVEHLYVGCVRSKASPENLAPNLRLTSQHVITVRCRVKGNEDN
jgi:hypothetical protein